MLNLVLGIGVSSTNYGDISTAQNNVNTAISAFATNLSIGESLYGSDIIPIAKDVDLVTFVDYMWTLSAVSMSQAGIIQIPLVTNYDLSNATLLDADNNVILSGDLSSYVIGTNLSYVDVSLIDDDQQVTLNYKPLVGSDGGNNIITNKQGLIFLNSLVVNAAAA